MRRQKEPDFLRFSEAGFRSGLLQQLCLITIPYVWYTYGIRMVNKVRRPSRKNQILVAAMELVSAHGIQALTIDGLGKATGATKGGIQYHFASKDQLVDDLLTWILEQFTLEVENVAQKQKEPHRWLRAYVRCLTRDTAPEDRVVLAILSDLPVGSPRMGIYKDWLQSIRQRCIEHGVDKDLSLIIQLAAESLWMDRIYGTMTNRQASRIAKKLFEMIP